MERRPGLAPGKNWFASSRLDGFGMRRIKMKEPPAGIAPASIPFRRRVPDLFEPRGRKLVRQPGVAPGRPLWKSGMLELLNITGAEKWSGTPVTLRVYPAPKAGGFLSSSCSIKLAPVTGLAPASSSLKGMRLDSFVFTGIVKLALADGFAPSPFRLTGGRTTVIPRWY